MRVLLKLSGEALSGEGKKGYDPEISSHIAYEVKSLLESGHEVGIVIGAGNLVRGKEVKGISLKMADQMGMLATVMNAIYLKELLGKHGIKSTVVSHITNLPSVDDLKYEQVDTKLREGYVVIFGGGTSNPFFTTDTAAALRAAEIAADVLLKATKVDGVYDKDPKEFKDAKKFTKLTFDEAIEKDLKVMDVDAFALCKKTGIDIIVFNFFEKGSCLAALEGKKGTRITSG